MQKFNYNAHVTDLLVSGTLLRGTRDLCHKETNYWCKKANYDKKNSSDVKSFIDDNVNGGKKRISVNM